MENAQNGTQVLIQRLEDASFTGELILRFEAGQMAAAELLHCLATSEFASKPLPGIEGKPQAEFSLKG